MRRRGLSLVICTVAAGALACGSAASGPAAPGRDRLRAIVQSQCVPLWLREHRADPCLSVSVGGPEAGSQGYAILHDRKGGAHYLLVATRTIPGIESPELETPGALNYFAAAWEARAFLRVRVGHAVPRRAVGIALNSVRARSQDQLHIHISCLGEGIAEALRENAERIQAAWSEIRLDGWSYQALRIPGAELAARNPLQLLAVRLTDPKELGRYTVLVAGMDFADGPGFALLASASAPGAELLLDSRCAIAGP